MIYIPFGVAWLAVCVIVVLAYMCFTYRRQLNQQDAMLLERAGMNIDNGPIDEVVDALVEQCGQEWVDKSLDDFTLAATVTRAIRWHKDTVAELKREIECDKPYIAMLESVALTHSNILAGQVQPSECESVRDFLQRRYDL